ncbi:MAG: TlpA family protein disulfide reductase [bacterium]
MRSVLLAAAACVAWCVATPHAANAAAKVGDPLPEVTLDLLDTSGNAGPTFKPTALASWAQGKPRLLLFVLPGHWPSNLESADLRAFSSALGGKVAVAVVTVPKPGIASATDLRNALGDASSGLPVFRDAGFAFASAVGIGSAPSYVFADRDGVLRVLGAKALAAPVSGPTSFADYLRAGIASGSFASLDSLPVYKPNQRLVGRGFVDLALPRLDQPGAAKVSDWAGKGKAVLLVFWSVRCPHCTKEMPHFAEVATKYADRLTLVSVARTADGAMEQETRQYLTSNSLKFPVLVDATGDAMDRYIVSSTPTSILIRADGNVLAIESGEIDNLAGWLDRHLGGA